MNVINELGSSGGRTCEQVLQRQVVTPELQLRGFHEEMSSEKTMLEKCIHNTYMFKNTIVESSLKFP